MSPPARFGMICVIGLMIAVLLVQPSSSAAVILSPSAGDPFLAESPFTIRWETSLPRTTVALTYSTDDGATWNNIGTVSDTGSYTWTIPDMPSTHRARIKLSRLAAGASKMETAISDMFTIYRHSAPTGLSSAAVSDREVRLTWVDNSEIESSYIVFRKVLPSTDYFELAVLDRDATQYVDLTVEPTKTYSYFVLADNTLWGQVMSTTTTVVVPASPPPPAPVDPEPTVIRLTVGSMTYYVDGVRHTMDIEPTVREGRTFLPIRYVAEPLGAGVMWIASQRLATVTLDTTEINLWLGNPQAQINGISRLIDPVNPQQVPFSLPPGRIMLPLRFIAENLGCRVDWDPVAREVTITYPAP